ncbi:hypothetical protein [Persephonella sp.]
MLNVLLIPEDVDVQKIVKKIESLNVIQGKFISNIYNRENIKNLVEMYKVLYDVVYILFKDSDVKFLIEELNVETKFETNSQIKFLSLFHIVEREKLDRLNLTNIILPEDKEEELKYFEYTSLIFKSKSLTRMIENLSNEKDGNPYIIVSIYDYFETEETVTVIYNFIKNVQREEKEYIIVIYDKIDDEIIDYKFSKIPFYF